MYVDHERCKRALTLLLILEAAVFAWFFASGRPLAETQWAFLEAQRPTHRPQGDLSVCADCLDFALARRALGGWNTAAGHVLELTNIPAIQAARATFQRLQAGAEGTSLSHSDTATVVFLLVVLGECMVGSIVLGIRRRGAQE